MTHARACCCTVDDDSPLCPGDPEFCLRASVGGISITCETFQGDVFGYPRVLVLDGDVDVRGTTPFFDGYFEWESQSGFRSTDTRFTLRVETACLGLGDNRYPVVRSARIDAAGGGTPGGGSNAAFFLWRRTVQNQWLRLDRGPVVLTNDYGDCVGQVSSNGTVTLELVRSASCPRIAEEMLIAVACDGSGDEIVVDPDTLTGGVGVRYQGKLYRIDRRGHGDPVPAESVDETCPDDPKNTIMLATPCKGTGEPIGYDSKLAPVGARTCLHLGTRYDLTRIETTLDPVGVSFSTRTCSGLDFPDCSGITGPDDPRCTIDEFRRYCPRCRRQPSDIGDPQPPVGRQAGSQTPQDEDQLPGLGDMLARAIELLRLDKLVDPERCGCERRKRVLNEFGQRYGRAIIKRLGL